MDNHKAAQKVKDMSEDQRGKVKKNLYGLIFKSLAVISLLGAVGAFFAMNGAGDDQGRYLKEGVVSQALVVDLDAGNKVRVVHNPNSTVSFASFGTTGQLSDLPMPVQAEFTGTIVMDDADFALVQTGSIMTVVNTPYEPDSPRTLASLTAPASNGSFLWMAIFAALAAFLWVIGRVVSKR